MEQKLITAVAGVLCTKDNMVLIASRSYGRSYAGYWEFSGGKIEAGETPHDALIRELYEEIGMRVQKEDLQHIIFIRQFYPDQIVELDVMLVKQWYGEIVAYENQELFWHDVGCFCEKSPLLPTTQKIFEILEVTH